MPSVHPETHKELSQNVVPLHTVLPHIQFDSPSAQVFTQTKGSPVRASVTVSLEQVVFAPHFCCVSPTVHKQPVSPELHAATHELSELPGFAVHFSSSPRTVGIYCFCKHKMLNLSLRVAFRCISSIGFVRPITGTVTFSKSATFLALAYI